MKWAGITLLGLIALFALLVIGINTNPGRNVAARQIGNMTFENGMRISIGRIEGSLFGQTVLRDVQVRDLKGVFLSAPTVKLDWRPLAYIRSHIDIRRIHIPLLTLSRVPEFKVVDPDAPLLPDIDLDIGDLAIDRLISEPAVSGERRELSLYGRARIADRRAQVTAKAETLAVAGGERKGDRLDLVLDAVPEQNRLNVKLALEAPKGGVLAALASLSDDLVVRLNGQGDWKKWDGALDADLAGTALARLGLAARDGAVAVAGTTQVSRLVKGTPAAILGPVLRLNLGAKVDQRRARFAGTIHSDALNLTPSGVVDFGENRFEDFHVGALVLRPAVLGPNLAARTLRAEAVLNGGFARPVARYTLSAQTLTMNDVTLEGLSATGIARVMDDRIVVPVSARVARIVGLDSMAGGTLTNVTLNGDLNLAGSRILSDNMRIRSDRIDAKAILLADTARGLYTGAIDGRINQYRIESVGIFDVASTADLKSTGSSLALVGKIRARSRQLFNSSVREFLGGNFVASSSIAYGADGLIRFSNLRLNAPLLRVDDGRGSYAPNGRIDLKANGHSRQYGPVAVELTGTATNPKAVIVARNPGLGLGLSDLRLQILGSGGGYRFAAVGDTDYGRLNAEVRLLQGRGPMTVVIDRGDLAGIGFTGTLVRTAAGPFTGQLFANGRGLAGVVTLGALGKTQEAVVKVRANDTVLPGPAQLAIGSAIIDARVVLYDRPWIVADVQLAQTNLRGLQLVAGRAQIDYRNGAGSAKFLAEGVSGVPFKVAGNADLTPQLWRAALTGRVRGVEFRTTSPARIVPGKSSYELLPTRVDFGQGNVRVAGTYGQGLKLQSRLDSMDLALLNAFLPGLGIGGKATGSLDFAQASPAAFPTADARLAIAGFTRTTALTVSQPIDMNVIGTLAPDGGEARAVMRRRGAVIGRMTAALKPLGPGAGSWTTRMLAAPLGGGIRYNGPAETLFSFAGSADQGVSGPIALAADFSGRVNNPQLAGIVRGEKLTYENQTYGTRLTNLALSGRFSGDRINIERLAATAGSGTIAGQGYISLASAMGYPMDMEFTLDRARLARSDAISSEATGNLRLSKTAGSPALLSGRLVLPETRYQMTRQGAALVPELTGVRFQPPRGRPRVSGDEPAIAAGSLFDGLRLDIALVADNQLFVTGMGLDSEWSANLRVTGTAAALRMAGEVDLVRGNLSFAGRRFALQEGRLLFTGGPAVDPQITLRATEEIDTVEVTVAVGGRAMNPQIAFTSNPGLPSDEIVSRILFGNSVGQLSPLQAVQLAASLNALRGTGGGLNPMGKLRAATGLAQLRVLDADERQGRGTALAVGSYIGNRIYLELITDARGFTATQIEISLNRALSIISQAGGSGVTQFNLRYRKRY